MTSFVFNVKPKFIFGKIIDHIYEFNGYGRTAYIITDGSSSINGALKDTLVALDHLKIEYLIFNEVEENPSLENVCAAAQFGMASQVEFIIALGGGSVIDAAKAASILIAHNKIDTNLLFNDAENIFVPVLAVPTTFGSGSEATSSSIITVHNKRTKLSIKRRVCCEKAFLHSDYSNYLPENVTVSTTIDVFSHFIDGYFSAKANYFTDKIAESAFMDFSKIIPLLKDRKFNDYFRETMMCLSVMGGIVISHTRTTLPHLLGYPLTYHKHIPHGFACGLLTYEFIMFHKDKERVKKFLNLSGFNEMSEVKNFFATECPRVLCTEDEIFEYAQIVYSEKERLSLHPYNVQFDDLIYLYKNSLY